MADGEVKIDTKLDTSGVDKGVNDLKKKLNDAGKTIDNGSKKTSGLEKNLGGVTKTALKTAAGVAGVAVAVKKTVDALNDCEAAYKVQQKAEIALQNAAKNNPYLNKESVANLKAYASELQNMSEVGDEVSLQVMAQLAAAGRNEEQIMQIMSAAADMAAVTGEDIASAAQKLNATLNGNAGTLGRQISSINNLTKAELENGKAIQLVADQYKGSAAAMADKTVQLNNAWGDFKENIGRGWTRVTTPIRQFFLDTLNDINEAIDKTANLKGAQAAAAAGTESAAEAKLVLDEAQAVLDEMDKNKGMTFRKGNGILSGYMVDLKWQEKRDAQAQKVQELTERYNELTEAENAEAEAQQKAAEAAERTAAARSRDEQATDHINANRKALAEQIKALQLKADIETNGVIPAQDLYNAYMQSYIDLITKSNGLVSENNSAAKERLALLQKAAEAAKDAANEEERLAAAEKARTEAEALLKELQPDKSRLEQLDEQRKQIEELKNKKIITEQEAADAMLNIDREYNEAKRDLWQKTTDDINSYIQNTAEIAQQFGDLMLKNVQAETDAELAALDEKYTKGELSETEYYEKQKQIKRKAAQEEYKIKMFEWSASILAATANIAEGVSKAIAQGGVAGLVTGALVGAAGAVQIGSIIAAKPVPPSFYTGGIIPGANGATMGGDNTYIHARAGEMVLNAAQQRSLWDKLNGQDSRGAGGYNLTVNNTQSGRVDTSIRQDNNGLIIDILDKHINKGFSDGTYDAGLAAMNTRHEGVRIV